MGPIGVLRFTPYGKLKGIIQAPYDAYTGFNEFGCQNIQHGCKGSAQILLRSHEGRAWHWKHRDSCTSPCGHCTLPIWGVVISLTEKQLHCSIKLYSANRLTWPQQFGGGKVTRFLFILLDIFIYISHWATRLDSQNRPHFEGDYRKWSLTSMLLPAIQVEETW